MAEQQPKRTGQRPVRLNHRTLNQRVYDEVREMILAGDLPFGAQLDEQALAEQLGISRTPLREAIAKLVKENLIEHRPWKGNFVRTLSAREVDDLYAVRKALEALAVRLAVPRLTDSQIATLRAILDEVSEALARHDLDAYSTADRRFHNAIAAFADNGVLIDALDRLGTLIHLVRNIVNRDPLTAARAAHERPLILAALEARDGERAAQLMVEHISHVQQHAVAELTAREMAARAAETSRPTA